MTHTPGPWAFDDSTGEVCRADLIEPLIATVSWDNTGNDQFIADCRLIAAAPEMLDALRLAETDCMAYVDSLYHKGARMTVSYTEASKRLATVRAAIAKATNAG